MFHITTAGRTLIVAGALMLAMGPAFAVTVTNQSDKTQTVTVDLGANEPKTDAPAGKTVKLDCTGGCELRVPTMSYGLAAKTGDKVVIGKDGMLAHEGQAAATEARNDADGKPGKAKAQ